MADAGAPAGAMVTVAEATTTTMTRTAASAAAAGARGGTIVRALLLAAVAVRAVPTERRAMTTARTSDGAATAS
jgi:hypothetical protein